MAYYIGVDGGGTKTAFALFDENKNMVAEATCGGSNHENLEGSFDEAADAVFEGLCSLTKKAGIDLSTVDFTLMGLAGIDHPFQHDAMCQRLRAKGLSNFEIFNDGFLVIKAGCPSGAGIGYNCGTGTCCNAIDSNGNMLQLGGLSALTGDAGNGMWIAENAFRLIYDELFLGLRKTLITGMYFERFGISSRSDFFASVENFEGAQAQEYIRTLIEFFFAAVNMGDAPALELNDYMARRGAQFISTLCREAQFSEKIEVVLSGSIHTKTANDIYVCALREEAQRLSGRELEFTKLSVKPVVGCVNWIFQSYR